MVAFLEAGVDASYVHILYQKKQDQFFWDFMQLKERYIYFEKGKKKNIIENNHYERLFPVSKQKCSTNKLYFHLPFFISISVFYLISYKLLTTLL